MFGRPSPRNLQRSPGIHLKTPTVNMNPGAKSGLVDLNKLKGLMFPNHGTQHPLIHASQQPTNMPAHPQYNHQQVMKTSPSMRKLRLF